MSDQKVRLIELDVLRVIGIGLIVALHLSGYVNYLILNNLLQYVNVPVYGVGILLFVSGYGLYLSNKNIDGMAGLNTFFKKRIVRIFPLYWLALFSYVIVLSFILKTFNLTFRDWFVYIFGLQFILKTDIPYIPVLWFVGVIIFFYILYAIILYFSKNTFETILYAVISYILLNQLIEMGYCTLLSGPGDIRLPVFYVAFFLGLLCGQYNIFQYSQEYTNKIPKNIEGIIIYCSIASFSVYLLHRTIFTIAHGIVADMMLANWINRMDMDIIMICIVIPILVILCYYLQKSYDNIIKNNGFKIKLPLKTSKI